MLGGIWGKFEGESRGKYDHLSLYTSDILKNIEKHK